MIEASLHEQTEAPTPTSATTAPRMWNSDAEASQRRCRPTPPRWRRPYRAADLETARDRGILSRRARVAAGPYHQRARLGPPGHPDFLHFFFDAGKGATIAFFYYIGTDRPEKYVPEDHHFYAATHTAWSVPTEEELKRWKTTLEAART